MTSDSHKAEAMGVLLLLLLLRARVFVTPRPRRSDGPQRARGEKQKTNGLGIHGAAIKATP
jgi:hypothetical protein